MVPRLLEQQACVPTTHLTTGEPPLALTYTVIFIVGRLYRDRDRLLINALLSLNATLGTVASSLHLPADTGDCAGTFSSAALPWAL